jgi:single-strand DNA-binding protein
MSRGINRVILIGHVGRQPESRYTADGKQIVSFSIATTDSWFDKTTQAKVEKTQWHRIVCYGNTASIAASFVNKGKQIYIEGTIKYGKYVDKSGIEKHTTDIVANSIFLLGSRKDNEVTVEHEEENLDDLPF